MELKETIVKYMDCHNVCTLATLKDNIPYASTVEYANEGLILYFFTNPATQKRANINANQRIALTIDEDYPDWMEIKGIQLEGEAEVLEKAEDIEKAKGIYINKYPFVAQFGDLEPGWIRITPAKVFFLDYEKGFGHRDSLEVK